MIIIQVVIGLFIVATAITYWGQLNNGEIQFAPILGVMFGALYSHQRIEEQNIDEHWLQCCILCVSITVICETTTNGLE